MLEERRSRLQFWCALISALIVGAAIFAAGATWFQPRTAQPQPIVIQLQAPK
jgi:Tfp pilus assembly protein PilN